jgi:hypothetical protein
MTRWIIAAVLLPVALAEFGEVSPWLARRIIIQAVRLLPSPRMRTRYAEEWATDLDRVPGKVTKLAYAITLLATTAPALGRQALRAERQAPGMRAAYRRAVASLDPQDLSPESLLPVVDIVGSTLGFNTSVLNLADACGNYVCVAIHGSAEVRRDLEGVTRTEQDIKKMFARTDPWGELRFINGVPPGVAFTVHIPETSGPLDDPAAWRPEYYLGVPLE